MSKVVDDALSLEQQALAAGVRDVSMTVHGGPEVDQYLAYCGLDPNEPWCCAFLVWCIGQACAQNSVPMPLPRTASCPVLYAFGQDHGVMHDTPQVGDAMLKLASNGTAEHTGMVTGVPGDGIFTTTEGNTNASGASHGFEVLGQHRQIDGPYVFLRWADLLAAAPVWDVQIGEPPNVQHIPGYIQDDQCFVGARTLATALAIPIAWNPPAVTVGNYTDAAPVMVGDSAFVPLRAACEAAGLAVTAVGSAITVTNPAAGGPRAPMGG